MPGFYEMEDMRIAACCMESLEDCLATGRQLYIAVSGREFVPRDHSASAGEYPCFPKSGSRPFFI